MPWRSAGGCLSPWFLKLVRCWLPGARPPSCGSACSVGLRRHSTLLFLLPFHRRVRARPFPVPAVTDRRTAGGFRQQKSIFRGSGSRKSETSVGRATLPPGALGEDPRSFQLLETPRLSNLPPPTRGCVSCLLQGRSHCRYRGRTGNPG